MCDCIPDWWPADTVCLVRRVRIPVAAVSASPRARRHRTIPKDQLVVALAGKPEHIYSHSFVLTNLDVATEEKIAWVEVAPAPHRYRSLNRDAKHSTALRHLLSGDPTVNTVWM